MIFSDTKPFAQNNMNTASGIKLAMLIGLWAASVARAQTHSAEPRFELGTNDPPSLNRISVAYRMGFLQNAKFKRLGGFAAKSNPGPSAGTGQVHNYDGG